MNSNPEFYPSELRDIVTTALADNNDEDEARLSSGTPIGNCIIDHRLGSGAYAVVYRATYNGGSINESKKPTLVAIKVFSPGFKYDAYANEVRILNKLVSFGQNHTPPKSLIKYYGTFAHLCFAPDSSPRIYPCIMFELAGASLSRVTKKNRGLPMNVVKSVARELFTALEYLHSANIIHCDIKTSNILVTRDSDIINPTVNNFHVVLCDLGISTTPQERLYRSPGTPGYISPEMIFHRSYGLAADIWSAMVVCFRLLKGDSLFDIYGDSKLTYSPKLDELHILVDDNSDSDATDEEKEMDVENIENVDKKVNKKTDKKKHKRTDKKTDTKTGTSMDVIADTRNSKKGSDRSYHSSSYTYGTTTKSTSNFDNSLKLHYLQLVELFLGPAPNDWEHDKKCYTTERKVVTRGMMVYFVPTWVIRGPKIKQVPLSIFLEANYDYDRKTAETIAEFLLQGLKYEPIERITATGALKHKWLKIEKI